jgi:putative tricarboxylic transport membrane protein
MPRIVSIIALFCIAGIILTKYVEAKMVKDSETVQTQKQKTAASFMGFIRKNIAIASLILIGIYIALMKPLGFILSSFLYSAVQIYLFAPEGKRRPLFIIILSAVFSVAMYLLFMQGFSILLPPGILG